MNHDPHPMRILQFGEGNFLRTFFDWMVDRMRAGAGYDGSVGLVKTIPGPFGPEFEAQDNAYTVVIRGRAEGRVVLERSRIDVISARFNPYEDFQGFLEASANPDVRVVVSNTTEAGIAWVESDRAEDRPAASYPGKLTQLLRARYLALGGTRASALLVMPCELIERNGQTLRRFVLDHARRWHGDPGFERWIAEDCTFVDTLVDRIVSGHDPEARRQLLAETGFDDGLLSVGEPYYLLAIQGEAREDLLPLRKAGLNAVWTADITPHRLLKVRILNGGHTFLAMVGPALGVPTVRASLAHPALRPALERLYRSEIIPALPMAETIGADLRPHHPGPLRQPLHGASPGEHRAQLGVQVARAAAAQRRGLRRPARPRAAADRLLPGRPGAPLHHRARPAGRRGGAGGLQGGARIRPRPWPIPGSGTERCPRSPGSRRRSARPSARSARWAWRRPWKGRWSDHETTGAARRERFRGGGRGRPGRLRDRGVPGRGDGQGGRLRNHPQGPQDRPGGPAPGDPGGQVRPAHRRGRQGHPGRRLGAFAQPGVGPAGHPQLRAVGAVHLGRARRGPGPAGPERPARHLYGLPPAGRGGHPQRGLGDPHRRLRQPHRRGGRGAGPEGIRPGRLRLRPSLRLLPAGRRPGRHPHHPRPPDPAPQRRRRDRAEPGLRKQHPGRLQGRTGRGGRPRPLHPPAADRRRGGGGAGGLGFPVRG